MAKQIYTNQLNTQPGDVITNPAAIFESLNAYSANTMKKWLRPFP